MFLSVAGLGGQSGERGNVSMPPERQPPCPPWTASLEKEDILGITMKEAARQKLMVQGATLPGILSSKPQHFQVSSLQAESPGDPPDIFSVLPSVPSPSQGHGQTQLQVLRSSSHPLLPQGPPGKRVPVTGAGDGLVRQ